MNSRARTCRRLIAILHSCVRGAGVWVLMIGLSAGLWGCGDGIDPNLPPAGRAAVIYTRLGGSVREDGSSPENPVRVVHLSRTNVRDADLAHLAALSDLEDLQLTGTPITDAGLVHLKQLTRLTKLNVTGTAVTEQGVKQAKEFLPFWITVTR